MASGSGFWNFYIPRLKGTLSTTIYDVSDEKQFFTGGITDTNQNTTAIKGLWDVRNGIFLFQTYPLSPDLSDLSLPEFSYSGTFLDDNILCGTFSPSILEDIESAIYHFPLPPSAQPWVALDVNPSSHYPDDAIPHLG